MIIGNESYANKECKKMYSHKNKSIFIHIPKTAGWTLHNILKRYADFHSAGHVGNFTRRVQQISERHYPSKLLKEKYLDSYFKFCFVRNPYDLLVSSYKWWKREPKSGRKRKLYLEILDMSFKEFILKRAEFINEVNTKKLGQHFWITNTDGNPLVDFIGKFENLQKDFNIICDKIGIPHQLLPHHNKTKHKCYTEYYDDETREIVAEKYAKDIEYFGYEFGE